MGHYFALVVSDEPLDYTIDELMAPYYQGTDGVPEDFLEFVEDECEDFDETAGRHGYWTNTYGYWDWFEIGGDCADILRTKDGTHTSQCPLREFSKLVDDKMTVPDGEMIAPHALVDEDGWHDWSSLLLAEAASTFHAYLEDLELYYPDAWLTAVDYHT